MDVRQFAFLARQPSAAVKHRDTFCGVPKSGLALILANALFWQPLLVQAEGIVVSGPGTTLGAAGNGVPVVNIATPNGSGLSHNQFKDYNVGANGLILNNATGRTQETQLGGIILGNPNLKGGAANIILNEVNGGSPSQLRGYTEVAGQSAKVIVANPYGITCNGCGFINTPNVTLTTGKPILDNGRLDRYQVDGGAVSIDGQGLNADNVDRFEIITRSAKINAQINARNLTVIAGRNDVNAQTLDATARADDGSAKPTLAIDSSALGGMYAGAIRLVGTEAGVGVKMDGTLAASGGDIQLDASGRLTMAQAKTESGAINIKAASVQTQGAVHAATTLDVQSAGDLHNQNNLSARDRITLTSGGQLTNSGIVEAGVNQDLSRNTSGDVSLSAQAINNNGSSLVASRNLSVSAAQALNNQGATMSAKQHATISAGTLDNQNKGRVLSTGSLSLNTSQLLNDQGGLVTSNGPLTATVGQLSNRSGEVSSLGAATLNIASLDNVAGLVTANQGLRIAASGSINNQGGKLTSLDTLAITAGAVDNSATGLITSNQALTANVANLNNHTGQLTSVKGLTLDVNKGQLNNQGGLIRGSTLALNNLVDVGNQSGEISSAEAFTFTANSLDNTGGKLLSDQGLTLRLDQALTNVKGLVSANGLDVRASSVNNSTGTLTSDASLSLDLDGALANNVGEVSSASATQVHAASLDNSGGKVTGNTALNVDVRGELNNRQGVLGSGQTASIKAASLDNRDTGKVLSDGSLTTRIAGLLDNQNNGLLSAKSAMDVQAGSLDNRGGSLSGKDLLTLNTASLDNRGGKVSADKDMQLNVGQLDNQAKGLISGQAAIHYLGTTLHNQDGLLSGVGPVRIDATTVENASGRISSQGDLTANVTHFNQQKGELVAQGNLRLTGSTLNNSSGGLIGATKALTLTVDDINNQAGAISSAMDVSLAGSRLNNSSGKLLAGTDLGLKVAQVINQSAGLLFGKGKVTLQGQSLDNSGGTVSGQQSQSLTLIGDLNNTGGLLTSEGTITATSAGLNNTLGQVSSAGAIALSTTGALTNQKGAVTSGQGLTLNSASLDNRTGTISAKAAAGITTGAFDNAQAGKLISNDTLDLKAAQVSSGAGSRIASDNALTASVSGFDQQGGQIYSKTSLSLDLNNGQLNNQLGLINAPLLMLKNLNGVNNQGGEISSAQAFVLTSKNLDNSNGKLISTQALTLRIDQALSNIKGLISAAALKVHSASLDNSSGMLSSRGELGVAVGGAFKNQSGSAIGDGNVQLAAASLDNRDGKISSKADLTSNIAAITNQNGALIAQGALALTGQTLDNQKNGFVGANQRADINVGAVDNRGGEISSKAGVQLTGQRLDNSDGGLVLAATDLKLNVDNVLNRNKGQLSGQSGVSLTGASLDNSGGSLVSQKDLGLELSGELNNKQGQVSSEGLLTVDAASLNNRQGRVSSAGALNVTTTGALDNQGGELVTDAVLTLNSASLDNSQKGTLSSTSALNITTGAFDNSHAGNVSTSDTLDISAGQLTSQDGGRLTSNKALTAKVSGLDQQGGKLFSNTSVALDLNHGQLNNQDGLINGPLLMLKNLKGVNNQGGEISSAQAFILAANSLDNASGKLLSNQALTLRINQALNNVKGLIAAQSIDGRAASLDNGGGTLTSRGDTLLNVDGQFSNQNQGLIKAANVLTLNSTGLNNQGGSVLGKSIAIDLGSATGDLNNTSGLITTDGPLTIKHLRDLSNQGGEISTAQNLNLSGRTLDNSAGKLISNNLLTLSGNKLVNQGGLMSGWQGVSVSGVDLDNRNQGTVSSRYGNVDASLSSSLLNSGAGALVSQKVLNVTAASLDNSDKGILSSAGGQTVTVTGLLNNAQGGLIDSGAALDLQVQTLNNAGGTVNAQQALGLTGTTLDNSAGALIGNGAVTLDLLGDLTNTNGKLASAGALLLKRGSQINNQGGQLVSQSLLTLFAGSLDNRNRGTVAANGTVTVTTTGVVQNNSDGLIYSQKADLQLKAASLDNAKGSVQSQSALNLSISGALDNQSGKVIAQTDDVDITAATIDNRGGTLASLKGALQAKALGGWLRNDFDLNNNRQAGTIQAQSLNLSSASLNNNGGRIAAQTGDSITTTGAFDNRDGGLYGKGTVKVTGSSFDNSGDVRGQVAGGQVDLNLSGALNNHKGAIESDTTLSVSAGSVDNQKGQLRALGPSGKTEFQIGGVFDNRDGSLETANSDLTLNVGSFQNVGGSVLHVGAGTFDISTANLTNTGGNVVTRGGLTLTADNWTNSSVIQAGRLMVNVNTLNQTAGGQLLASNTLVGNGGNWSNDGLIASDGSLQLTLGGTYSGSGRASSQGTFGLSATQVSLAIPGSLAGGGTTSIDVGQLINRGRITSVSDLNIKAGTVQNIGTLGAAEDLTITAQSLINDRDAADLNIRGFAFSGESSTFNVNDFTNNYGEVVSLGSLTVAGFSAGTSAQSFRNTSGNIQSTGDMTLAANEVVNEREKFQLNQKLTSASLSITCIQHCGGGWSDRRTQLTLNRTIDSVIEEDSPSATLSTGRNLSITSQNFSNKYSVVSATNDLSIQGVNIVNQAAIGGSGTGNGVYTAAPKIPKGQHNALVQAVAIYNRDHPPSSPVDEAALAALLAKFNPVIFAGINNPIEIKTNGVIAAPAIIQAAGNAKLSASNDISNINVLKTALAVNGRALDTAVGDHKTAVVVVNAQLPPDLAQQQINPITLPGFDLPSGQNGLFRLSQQESSAPATLAPQSWSMGSAVINTEQRQQALPINPGREIQLSDASQASASTLEQVQAIRQKIDVVAGIDSLNVVAPAAPLSDAELPGRTVAADPLKAAPVGTLATAADTQTINRVQGLPTNLVSSQPHKYLIETNPALTNLKQFMSSDYLLSKLGYNPDDSWKRLGDGFYEQRLIQQAVVARTGQRFLAGVNTDEQLFKYLMDNALKSKQTLDLAVGVSLTSEQVAALTHDIVWLEKNLVNGEEVLVPVLYLAHSNNRLAPNGALIAGNDLSLIAGKNLDNAGTLRASNNLSAQADNDLTNSGLIEAGNRLDLLAGNNIVNKSGGIIAGRDVSLKAINGDVINERTITTYREDHGNNRQLQQGYADSAARIEAANNLSVGAGRDVNNQGGVLRSGADITIQGGRDVNITSAEQMSRVNLNSKISSQDIKQFGSALEAGRDLKVGAGRDINAIASQIDAKRDIAMAATDNLTLASAANEQHSGYNSKRLKIQEDHVQQVSTTLKAGGDVALSAGQDLALIASRVTAGDEAYLVSGKNLELKSAEDQDYSFYSKTKKSSSGKKFRLDETDSTTNIGSLVTSGGNSTLVAGENLLLAGSGVNAEKGTAKLVAGEDVQILAVSDSDSARHERKQSKSSWGGFKSSKVQDKVAETRTTAVGSMVSGETVSVAGGQDVTVTGSALVSTADLTVQAGRDLTIDAAQNTFSRTDMHKEKSRDLTGVLTGNKLGLDDITGNQHLSISSQKRNGTAQETTLTGSTVGSSAGNVSLTGGRTLSVVASDLVSTKDMALGGSDVTIAAGTQTASQTTQESSKSLAVGRVIGGTVVDTARSIRDGIEAAKDADDPRLKAVKLAQVALNTYNLGGQAVDANGQSSGFKDKQGGTASNGSLIKIGTELSNTRSKSSSEYHSETARQSTLNAGQALSIVATGKAAETQGDIHVIGSDLKAANTTLVAKNDIILESAQNTTERKNDSKNDKTSIGASFNIGEQNGFTLDLGAQIAKNMGSGSSVTQVNTTLETGALVLNSGQDTTLAGAQVRADSIKADIGGDLNIASRQDIDTQKSKQSSAGAGASICVPPFCYGTTVAASGSVAAGDMNSDYKAVTDQTGLYAGQGGYDINVGKTTTLQGAVIASEASADENQLDTDRLLTSDIKNTSKIKSTSASAGISGSSSGLVMGPPMGAVLSESDSSKTRAAVSEGTIVVRNPEGASDLVGLNRDTQNANKHLDKPDEKAMRERMDLINSSAELARTIGSTIAKAKVDESEDPNSDIGKAARQKLRESGITEPTTLQVRQQAERDYGMGSSFQRTTQTVTAIVQGIAGGNVGAAIAGASAPHLAQLVKDMTPDDDTANLMAHAVLGAVLARASGNSALVGASGAVAAEATAKLIRNQLYGDVSNDQLTAEQKQTISALSTLVAGVAGSAVGKDALSAVAAAQVGKNAVENNQLSSKDVVDLRTELANASKNGEPTEAIWEKYKKLSAEKRAEMLEGCAGKGGLCSVGYQAEYEGGIQTADGVSSLHWFFDLSEADASRLKQFVTEENQNDMGLLYNSLPAWEKAALLGKEVLTASGASIGRDKTSIASIVGKGKGGAGGQATGAKATGASLDNVASSIHAGQQGKHVLGHNNFLPGRSYLNEGVDPQKLLNGAHAGEFPVVGYGSRGQPIVDFGKNIGVDGTSGLTTRYGTIHSGKSGAHIVPTNPTTVGAKP